ncbi:MAG TPA: TPM domain-containing protein [Holophagaceae bacterium]|nr:TPM domain-containing protein [Holophagaceae bacterium]
MRPFRRLLVFALLAAFGLAAWAEPSLPPAPKRWATDRAHYLREETRARLDAELKAHQAASQHQVILWIGDSLQGIPIEDFSARAMRAWGIGRKQEKDGVVFFVFAKDRKLRIEVGYGLEGQLPDAIANRILQERVVPRLKAGDPDGALEDGVHAILAVLDGKKLDEVAASAEAGEPQQAPPPPLEPGQEPPSSADSVGCIVMGTALALFLGFIGLIIWQVRKKGGVHWSSSSSGRSTWESDSSGSSSDSSSSSDDDFSGGGGDSGGGGASSDW